MARKSLRKLGTLKEEIFAEEIFADSAKFDFFFFL